MFVFFEGYSNVSITGLSIGKVIGKFLIGNNISMNEIYYIGTSNEGIGLENSIPPNLFPVNFNNYSELVNAVISNYSQCIWDQNRLRSEYLHLNTFVLFFFFDF